jgi:spore coat polysaccharide biosynthesis protein SpsF (cytidylyltransferase family)
VKIAGLVQARMGSTRLPRKVMLPLAGRPLVGHIFDRLRRVPGLSGLVLATTRDPANDPLAAFAAAEGALVFRARGEDDIAERLAGAAALAGADAILKVNGDCPLVDPAVLSLLVERYRLGDVDYVSNKIVWTWPEGLSAELIGRVALDWCDANLTTPADREFVANWIRDHGERFRVASVEGSRDLSHHRWTVDTPEDYAFMQRVFAALHPRDPVFGLDAVLAHLAAAADARAAGAAPV